MKKTTKRTTRKRQISVTLVRPTEEDETVTLPTGSTVEDALTELDYELPDGQSMYVGANEAELEDMLEDGDILQVIGKKEGGADDDNENESNEEEESNESEDSEEEEESNESKDSEENDESTDEEDDEEEDV